MSWQFNNREAVFLQIANRLRNEILGGTYASGEQLPTVRQFAYDAGVNPNTMQRALAELEGAVSSPEFGADILAKALFLRCAVLLNRMMLSDSTAADDFCRQDPKISDVLNYINANLSADLSIESLADRSYMSKYHFMRRFKELTGYTVHNYILQKRLIYASELIRDGMAVTQAALQSGFGDYSSFLRAFKKLFGTTPGKVSARRQG